MRPYELVDYQGKLALHVGTQEDWGQPILRSSFYVSEIPVTDWPDVIGCTVSLPAGVQGRGTVVTRHGAQLGVPYGTWHCTQTETPIKPPRNGREYGWKWGCGRRYKDSYSRCPVCYGYHDPAYVYCEQCGKCRPVKHKCKQ